MTQTLVICSKTQDFFSPLLIPVVKFTSGLRSKLNWFCYINISGHYDYNSLVVSDITGNGEEKR